MAPVMRTAVALLAALPASAFLFADSNALAQPAPPPLDVAAADVFRLANTLYADWKRTPDPFLAHPVPAPPPLARSEVVLVEKPVETFQASFQWHGPSTVGPTTKDTYAADLLSSPVGDPASRFQSAVVDSGACVRAGMDWYTQRHVGPISLDVEAAPDKVDACLGAALAELPKMKQAGYFSDEELRGAVHRAEVRFARQRERTNDCAHMLTFMWADASLDYYETYLAKMAAVTPADLARYLDTYVLGRPFVLDAMASPKLVAAGVDRHHLERVVLPEGGAR